MMKTLLAAAVASAFSLGVYAQNNANQTGSSPDRQMEGAAGQAGGKSSRDSSSSQSWEKAKGQANTNPKASNGQQDVEPLEVMREAVMIHGIVHSVDPQNRIVALQGSGGHMLVVHVGDDVQNFEKLKVGEPATIRYREAAVVAIERGGGSPQSTQSQAGQQSSGHKQASSQPQSGPGMSVQTSVIGKVTSIDQSMDMITIQNRQGEQIELRAPPDALSNISKGDQVFVTYSEAAAVSVQPDSMSKEQQSHHASGQMKHESSQ